MWPSFSPFLGGDFYPRPPRGGRPTAFPASSTITKISIHALREEGDIYRIDQDLLGTTISIHALREEGDTA